MPPVAAFTPSFLAYSETFIYDELRHHRRYAPEVFAWRRSNAAAFPFEPVHVGGATYRLSGWSSLFARSFRERRFPLVHAYFGTSGVYALPYVVRHGLPLVVSFLGADVPALRSRKLQHWAYGWLGPHMLRRMTLGLCMSSDLREHLLELGVPEDRLVVHCLGVDVEAFRPGRRDPDNVHVVMVGRFVEKKGFEYGIRAFARVARPGLHLTVVGDGARGEKLRSLVLDLGLSDHVTFAGVLRSARVAELLARSDVLLAPSVVATDGDREGAPTVIKEASACGVVPISTWHAGIHEIIDDGVTGFLVPERNIAALAERLSRLIDNPERRHSMGAAARAKMVRELDVRQRVEDLERHYDAAIRRHALER